MCLSAWSHRRQSGSSPSVGGGRYGGCGAQQQHRTLRPKRRVCGGADVAYSSSKPSATERSWYGGSTLTFSSQRQLGKQPPQHGQQHGTRKHSEASPDHCHSSVTSGLTLNMALLASIHEVDELAARISSPSMSRAIEPESSSTIRTSTP